ncbi:MAG: TlpA disulfide reductase family protein [bacterium]|nr:TlpA family protein disulfide reductase [Candidatus Margulisiibacteriota bacterium]
MARFYTMGLKINRKVIIIILMVGLMGLWVDGILAMGKGPSKQEAVIDFTLQDPQGNSHTLSDYKGKFVFLNFWATWCPPCRQEMPSMQELYKNWDSNKYVMLAVNVGESRGEVAAFAGKYGYTFPILLDKNRSAARQYGVSGFPTTFFINTEGKMIKRIVGAREWTDEHLNSL